MAYKVSWNGMSQYYYDALEAQMAATAYGGTVEQVEDPRRLGPGPVREATAVRSEIFDTVGGLELAEQNRERPRVETGVEVQAAGKPKFTKNQAIYVSSTRWPFVSCGTCVYFQPTAKTCQIVSEELGPDPGFISQDALCNLWSARAAAPAAGRIRIAEAMVGRGPGARGFTRPGGTRDRILERIKERVY